jgi:hypothetical protein
MLETLILRLYPSDSSLDKDLRRVADDFVENNFYLWTAEVDPLR